MATALRTLICPHCHTETETSGAYCAECGARLKPSHETQAASPPPAAPSLEPSAAPAPAGLEDGPSSIPGAFVAPATAPAVVKPGDDLSLGLSPEEWMLLLTAMGHYAGVLQEMNLEAERDRLMKVYRKLLKRAK